MKTFYYYMPPCPKCGSERTGRYVVPTPVNKHYMMIESLKNGELVRYRKQMPEKNAFCDDCSFEWKERPRLVRIAPEEKEEEIAIRETDRLLEEYLQKNEMNTKKSKFRGVLSGLIHFF